MSDKVAINDFEEYYLKNEGQTKVFYGWNTINYNLVNTLVVQGITDPLNFNPIRFRVSELDWDSVNGDKFVKTDSDINHMVFKQKGVYNIEFQLVFLVPINGGEDETDFMYGIFLEDGRTQSERIDTKINRFVASGTDPNFPYVVTNSSMIRYFDVNDHFELWFYLLGPSGRNYKLQGASSENSVISYLRITKLY